MEQADVAARTRSSRPSGASRSGARRNARRLFAGPGSAVPILATGALAGWSSPRERKRTSSGDGVGEGRGRRGGCSVTQPPRRSRGPVRNRQGSGALSKANLAGDSNSSFSNWERAPTMEQYWDDGIGRESRRSSMLHVSVAGKYVRWGGKPGLDGNVSRPERDGADESEDRRDRRGRSRPRPRWA